MAVINVSVVTLTLLPDNWLGTNCVCHAAAGTICYLCANKYQPARSASTSNRCYVVCQERVPNYNEHQLRGWDFDDTRGILRVSCDTTRKHDWCFPLAALSFAYDSKFLFWRVMISRAFLKEFCGLLCYFILYINPYAVTSGHSCLGTSDPHCVFICLFN